MATVCKQYQHISKEDSEEVQAEKKFLNSILADRKPYFFRYNYKQLNKEYTTYMNNKDEFCKATFHMSLKELRSIPVDQLTLDQINFLHLYEKFLPVLDSDCVMNKLCRYIESVDFHIKQKVRSSELFDWRTLVSENFAINIRLYQKLSQKLDEKKAAWERQRSEAFRANQKNNDNFKAAFDKDSEYSRFRDELFEEVCSDAEMLANHMVYYFYVDHPSANKNMLWDIMGRYIYEVVESKTQSFYFPQKNPHGTLQFLYDNYSIERFVIPKEEPHIEPEMTEESEMNEESEMTAESEQENAEEREDYTTTTGGNAND